MLETIKRKFIKYFTKIYDPLVDLKIGNQTIKIYLSHPVRPIVDLFPEYNFNLPRIIKYINDKTPGIKVIDIGANMGDTVAYIKNYVDAPILCIEGSEKYAKIVEMNVAKYPNVSVCRALVGSENKEVSMNLKLERGTAFLEESSHTTQMRTLDNILEEYADFKDCKIIKVDTDGFDTLVLRGCTNILKKNKPVLFFEMDPYLVSKNNDDPFAFIEYLRDNGYYWFMFYNNIGDYMLSCSIDQKEIIDEVLHYFSRGRAHDIFTDICAFAKEDKDIFEFTRKAEVAHFRKSRGY